MEKMIPEGETRLICCNSSWGPTFGDGCDLRIADDCNTNRHSYTNFTFTFNCEGPLKYLNSQHSYMAFSGATLSKYFMVEEYEVFQVLYK